jgi:hypothetical protein
MAQAGCFDSDQYFTSSRRRQFYRFDLQWPGNLKGMLGTHFP